MWFIVQYVLKLQTDEDLCLQHFQHFQDIRIVRKMKHVSLCSSYVKLEFLTLQFCNEIIL
jgi:hypothetical protein